MWSSKIPIHKQKLGHSILYSSHTGLRKFAISLSNVLFVRCDPCIGGTASFSSLCGEWCCELFWNSHVLQLHIVGQAVPEGWIGFADDKRGQVAASRLRDTKAISADKVVGQQLLPIGDLGQGRSDNIPPIRRIAQPADRRHHRILAGEGELHRGTTDGIG